MDGQDNAGPRLSRIPHPRAPTTSGLQELTESQHNSRSMSSLMRNPTSAGGIKRSASEQQAQPEPKRQTFIGQTGEPNAKRPIPGLVPLAVAGKAPTALPRAKSIASFAKKHTKHASATAHLSYMPPSTTTRGTRLPPATRHRSTATLDEHIGNVQREGQPTGSGQKTVLDVDERLREVESQFFSLKDVMSQSLAERKSADEVVELAKTRANDLQRQRDQLEEKNSSLQSEIESLRQQLQSAVISIEGERREKSYQLEDLARSHQRELDDLRREFKNDSDKLKQTHQDELEGLEKKHKAELADERKRTQQEMDSIRKDLGSEQQDMKLAMQEKDQSLREARKALDEQQLDLEREKTLKDSLQRRLADATAARVEWEEKTRALQAQVDFLKSDSKQQSDQYAEMEARMQQALKQAEQARQKLFKEETERRILFNKYQELKGNIRVMCRVRPAMAGIDSEEASIAYPDAATSSSQIDVTGPEEKSSLGAVSRKTMPFEFDRVFGPGVQNDEVFNEIAQLVQSALDGYNVCIFCYGQTGSGKTYTMSSEDGMIPRATRMIYENIGRLAEKAWNYSMEGSFVEVYNEELHDLLGPPAGSKDAEGRKKLEVRHDDIHKSTTVLNCKTVQFDSADKVEAMLQMAQKNRSVAATKSNERSSRSHSVFILKLVGENTATGERCEGTLNLVDLAGSERLKQSGAEGDRKKETQNINKSLACLGDVIEALGRGAPHVPYRNSKLTHLLQYSLGGNSKTLMFVMVSPLETHLKETITSLRFATKVHNTHIGTAKSTKKIKDR